ncbi:MAG: NAD(P)(+) transhydrogenase (Re/Si-specific) subunit beta, partial [Gemmatimonadota bacterium]
MTAFVPLFYLVASVLFILGLRWLSSPDTAVMGNRISSVGMLLAVLIARFDREVVSFPVIVAGMVVGTAIGIWMARAVRMTGMPQMVALLNGFGGGASLVVGAAEFLKSDLLHENLPLDVALTMQLAILIGAVTLSGSLIAWAKLQEVMSGRAIIFPFQKTLNALLFLGAVGAAAYQVSLPESVLWAFYALLVIALIMGVTLVIPIGGADMPVVISLLNSYSGIAAAMTGFVIRNEVLIIAGALVGSSGIILSQI